jgi:hypothetical protein
LNCSYVYNTILIHAHQASFAFISALTAAGASLLLSDTSGRNANMIYKTLYKKTLHPAVAELARYYNEISFLYRDVYEEFKNMFAPSLASRFIMPTSSSLPDRVWWPSDNVRLLIAYCFIDQKIL